MSTVPTYEIPAYAEVLDSIFGSNTDSMAEVERRADAAAPGAIVWEGDAATFQFLYVGRAAEDVLGHSVSRWTSEPTFWADVVLHPDDRDHAISYCALCTGQNQDHDFEYRAVTRDGRVLWLHDIVRVVKGPKGFATHLRGIMFDVTGRRAAEASAVAGRHDVRTDVLAKLPVPHFVRH